MVKKHKGGRRQILQLEDKKQPSRSESDPSSSAFLKKEASQIDTQVADFFKEIDALTVNNHTEADNSEDIASGSKQKDSEESNSLDGLPEKTDVCLADGAETQVSHTDTEKYCPWQEICDESTGYNYYWNIETNQVTWDCPSEYIAYLKSMHSTGGEDNSESHQPNSNENHKKSKKKDIPQPPEGAIIPISYYGGSSSEDSSDEEKDKDLGTTSKHPNFKTEPNVTNSSKNVSKTNDLHCRKKKKEPCVEIGPQLPDVEMGPHLPVEVGPHLPVEVGPHLPVVMGPHLPDESNYIKEVSSASIPSKELEISSKNEVDEFLEIGSQFSYNLDPSKNKDVNTDCNTVSDSSSKCTNVLHSIKNGPSDASSSTVADSWELSLKIIEREFKGLDQDIGEDSPDSTVKKGDNFSENSVPYQTSNENLGIRGVVEYDNSDEEEEMSSSNISSSKQESMTADNVMLSQHKLSKDEENSYQEQKKCHPKTKISQSEPQQNLFKRKFTGETNESKNLSFKKSKQKSSNIDFDKMFNNHCNSGKYGFGFSRQEQLNLENEFFCSTSTHTQSSYGKGSNEHKAINFVKSDHVFDLSTLNKDISSDTASQSKLNEIEQVSDNKNESVCVPEPSGLNLVKEVLPSKETLFNESEVLENDVKKDMDGSSFNNNSITLSINTETGVSFAKDSSKDSSKLKNNSSTLSTNIEPSTSLEKDSTKDSSKYKNSVTLSTNSEPSTSYEKDRTKDVLSSSENDILKMDEDIDEIDRQLSEALEAKKIENASSKPSSSSSSTRTKNTKTDSSVLKMTRLESAKFASNAPVTESLSGSILSLSSLLIDKLTFLISNHSTLTSLSSLLIQIQTRLMDWQASALDSRYFMSRLQEVEQYLHHYEISAVSGDWTCQWDREHKRYFYVNNRTQQSQWSYPEELCDKENSWMPSSTDLASTSTALTEQSFERDELQTVSSSVPEGLPNNKSSAFTNESNKDSSDKYSDSSLMWTSESSPPPPPPGVDSPPPPPPLSPPPDSPPPPPPDSTEVEDLLEDMDIENSDDSNPPLIVTNSGMNTSADTVMPYTKFAIPSPERASETFSNASVTNAVSSTSLSSFEDMNTVSKSPYLVSTSRDTFDTADSVNMLWSASQPSCSTDIASNFDSESEANMLPEPKLLSSEKDCDANASSSSSRNCEMNASSTSSRNCDLDASSTSSRNSDINASSSSTRNCDINASSTSNRSYDVNASSTSSRSYDVNASSTSSMSYDVNASSTSHRNNDVNASSTSSRNYDLNASSSSSRNCDLNASSSSYRNCDVNASSSSYKNCDVNASSSSYRSCDVNASSSSSRSCDVNASCSSSESYICSNEVTTYLKNSSSHPSTSTSVSASTTSTTRKEKKKAKLSSGLALKKKNIPSLVEKWQKIKKEQEKEDEDSEDT